MPNERPEMDTPPADETTDFDSLEGGIALALQADDGGDWKPLVRWLERNPALAGEIAHFIADQDRLRGAIPPAPPAAPDLTGTGLGGLELKEVIGTGGMAVVHRAYDPKLKRDVAVKLDRAAGPADLSRFRLEAETIASLDHPNIVRVHSSGEIDGRTYLVMPLLNGSLADKLKALGPDHRLPEKEAAELVRDVARGVHHAHQRGLIHRDLKPANILLNGAGLPHVSDFGLARPVDVSASSTAGNLAGTVPYMAPEQARGEKGLTTAADVWALGATLFELLTGRTPFRGSDVMSVLRHIVDEPVPPVRVLRPGAHRDLEAICLKCLEKRPEDRYPSAEALAEDLQRFLNGEPVRPQPPGFWDWLSQLARTRPDPHQRYSWQVTAWFGAIFLVTNVTIYGMVQRGAPALGVWGTNLGCSLAMGFVLWRYMMRRFRQLPVTERHSLIIAVGHVLAYLPLLLAYVPFSLAEPARPVLATYPPMALISGLGLFTLGSTNWSRFFPIGLAVMACAPVLANYPDESPLIFGSIIASVMWYWTLAKRRFRPPTESQ